MIFKSLAGLAEYSPTILDASSELTSTSFKCEFSVCATGPLNGYSNLIRISMIQLTVYEHKGAGTKEQASTSLRPTCNFALSFVFDNVIHVTGLSDFRDLYLPVY